MSMQTFEDIYLFVIVGVLLGVDFVFLVIITGVENSRLERREEELDNVSL